MEAIMRQLICNLSHYLQGFSTIQTVVGIGMSEPSTVSLHEEAVTHPKMLVNQWLVGGFNPFEKY